MTLFEVDSTAVASQLLVANAEYTQILQVDIVDAVQQKVTFAGLYKMDGHATYCLVYLLLQRLVIR